MRSNLLIGGLLATALVVPALAQSNPPASAPKPAPAPAATAPAPAATAPAPAATNKTASEQWRASKLIGLNVYNDQNEKLGDISELLLDKEGKVAGVVIGVGGFLGMGEHDIAVSMDKLKFMEEAVKTSSTAPAKTTTTTTRESTTGAATAPATTTTTTTPARTTAANDWVPDHAVMSGTKEQLKAMPQFKYSDYN